MRKLKVWWYEDIPKEYENKIDEYLFNKYRNSLISKEGDKYYFNSQFKPKEEIQIEFNKLNFEELFVEEYINRLKNMYLQSMIDAKNISSEEIGDLKYDVEYLYNIFYSLLQQQHYLGDNLLFFIAKVFAKLISSHPLENGNKRTSLMFLISFLYQFGYYFKWTKGASKNFKYYSNIIAQFAQDLSSKNSTNKEEIINNIYKWISNNVIIDLRWVYEF